MGKNIRVSGVSLRVEGAEKFASDLDSAQAAMRRQNAELKLLDATFSGARSSDYYGQRMQKLGAQLDIQKKKTETLRQARDAYAKTTDADTKKLEQLSLKIIASQTEEAKLAAEIKKCSNALDDQAREAGNAAAQSGELSRKAEEAGNAQRKLARHTDSAGKSLRNAKNDARSFGEQVDAVAGRLTKIGAAMTRLATLPIIGMGTAGLKFSIDFEDAMWETATMPGFVTGTIEEQQRQLDALGDELLRISDRTHTAGTDLAAGQYQALSSGVAKEDSAYWAERAAMAAKAGKSDVETVIDGASSINNAWKEAAGGIDHILDGMIVAQNVGKTTVGEISSQVGQVAGLAPQLKISFDEIMAATAALTANGLTTSSAITGLRGVMSAVIKPSSEAAKTAKKLGLEFSAAAVQAKGLTGFLLDVQKKTGGNSAHLSKLFGEVEGLNAVMMLGSSSADLYADALDQVRTAEGALDEAFAIRISSRSERLAGSLNRIKNSGIQLTESLYPAVDRASELLDGISAYMGGMDEEQQKTLLSTLAVTAAIGPLTKAAGKLLTTGKTVVTGMGKMMTAGKALAAAMTGPWGWITLAIAGIGGLGYAIYDAQQRAEALTRRSLEFDVGINDQGVQDSVVQIRQKLADWTSSHTLSVYGTIVPKVDREELSRDLDAAVDAAFKDRTVTVDEYVRIHTQIVDIENEAQEGVTSEDTAVREVALSLQSAVDDYNALLETIYRKGDTATNAELMALETALERVKTLRAELLGLKTSTEDVETQTYRSAYELGKQGIGGPEVLQGAVAYALGSGQIAVGAATQRRADLQEEKARELTAAHAGGADEVTLKTMESEYDALIAEAEAAVEEAQKVTPQRVTELITALLANDPETSAWLAEGGDALAAASAAHAAYAAYDDEDARAAYLARMLPDRESLARYGVDEKRWLDAYGMSLGDFFDDPTYRGDLSWLPYADQEAILEELTAYLDQKLVEWGEKGVPTGMEAVNTAYYAFLAEGFDPSGLDVGKMDGALADYMRIMLYDEQGLKAIGTEAMNAIGSAITEAADDGSWLPDKIVIDWENAVEALPISEVMLDAISGVLKPAGEQQDVGLSAGASIRQGLIASMPAAVAAAASMAAMINAQLGTIAAGASFIYPGAGLAPGSGGQRLAFGGSTTNDFSSNITFQHAVIGGSNDVQSLAARIVAENRARASAYGLV